MDQEGLLFFNCSGVGWGDAQGEARHRTGGERGAVQCFLVIFLGALENSLGEMASEVFANIQQGE